jgi:predicted phage baseplate assembly protein
MPLQAPNLDTRKFEDLLSEARLRILRYNPGWTDFNESDPGITLVELFAWITELMLYQFNQVPGRNYIKFLQLMGLELRPAQAAVAHLTFKATPGAVVDPIPRFTAVTAQPAAGGDSLIFETDTGLDIIRADMTDLQVFDGSAFSVVTVANEPGGGTFAPLGIAKPGPGSALYMGFTPPDPPATGRIFPQEIRLRVFLSEAAQAGGSQDANAVKTPPSPPVQLVWEYRPAADPKRWRPLNVFLDESLAFTREGYIQLEGPADIAATVEGRIADARYWLRARLDGGSYPEGRIPQLDFIRFNTAPAVNLSTVREEDTGPSDGSPGQTFKLFRRPVVPASLVLTIEIVNQTPEIWVQVEDFLGSGKDDPHYTFNGNTAEIRFGDGTHGRIPSAGATIVATQYRFGGGASGNVAPGEVNGLPGNINGLASVTNERSAAGGRDEQDVNELMAQAPHELRSRNRAVTAEDFAWLAGQAGGVAKATAIALMHPDHPGVDVPGAVTVVIVPDNDALAPMPSADQLRTVSAFLNGFRLLTTELFVTGPRYTRIDIEALVVAQPYASFDAVARDVAAALNFYFDPLARMPKSNPPSAATLNAAGTEQWNFGESLHPTNLFSVILGVAGVVFVPSLRIAVDLAPHQDLSQPVFLPPDGLLSLGSHQITVVAA